jgi:bis(5'-nucleosyl)-tetraphosphatase (symmetrical)
MPTYAIGDIQGCCDEFEQLLDLLNFDPQRDRLWLVGDLVNRGPKSLDVLRKVRALGEAAISVLGNHDLHLLALAISPQERRKRKDTLDEVLAAPDRDELLHWLRHRPILHHDATLGYTMIHAGLPPQWDFATAVSCARELETALRNIDSARELFEYMYGDQPDLWRDDLRGTDRLRFITNCFSRLRFCTDEGRLQLQYKGRLDQAPPQLKPWFRAPNRRSRDMRIVCGHWSALGYHDADGVLCIDTGCVWGASLCAARLDRRELPVTVPCSSAGLSVDGD